MCRPYLLAIVGVVVFYFHTKRLNKPFIFSHLCIIFYIGRDKKYNVTYCKSVRNKSILNYLLYHDIYW